MNQLFSLAPLATLLLFLLPFKGKGRRGMGLAVLFSVGALLLGWNLSLLSVSFLYVLIFLSSGLFQLPLKQEVYRAVGKSLPRQLMFQEEIAKFEEECRHQIETKGKLEQEMEELTRRFSFARSLVSKLEEESILNDMAELFSHKKAVKGFLFSTIKEESERRFWEAKFSSGDLNREAWNNILEKVPTSLNRSGDRLIAPLSSYLSWESTPFKNNASHIFVGEPIRWEKRAGGLLSFVIEEPLHKDVMEEISFCAQVLGFHFRKNSLYRTVLERSRRDGLTNLYLRRVFLERIEEEIHFSKRYGTSFSLLMLDLDHFKRINDTQGHLAGDNVLKSVAQTLRETLHPGVTLCRYGGEEFAALIGLAPKEEVKNIAEGLRSAVEEKTGVTVSVGIANYLPDSPPLEELIRRSDGALYKAKGDGRNCVREWS